MQQEEENGAVRSELLERLRAMDGPQSSSALAELAYRRAREALERALEEARTIRLQAIEDAKTARERELTALMDSLRGLRQAAEAQIEAVLQTAQIEASRLRDEAQSQAQALIEQATNEAQRLKDEAAAIRAGAEERAATIKRLEDEFNELMTEMAHRIGLDERPDGGWWRRLTGRKRN
jgi:hypothetical protein